MGVVIRGAISVSKQKGWKAWVTGATDGSCDQRRYQCSQTERMEGVGHRRYRWEL